jgi:hypothetical protein
MLSRFVSKNPDSLSKTEQILSALVGATLATVAMSALVSVVVVVLVALLR